MREYGPLILRLSLGAVFIGHGAQKLFGVWGGGGLSGTAGFFQSLGLAPALPIALLVGIAEFGGGVLLVLGAFTRWAALALAVEMGIAVWKVHFSAGFFLNWYLTPGVGHGYEFNLVLVAGLLSLIFTGPGAFSLDGYRVRSAEAEAAGRARLRAGNV
jgi:putative oxidoreductase